MLDDTLLSEFTFRNVTFTFINLQKMTPEFKFLTLDYLRPYFIKIMFFIKTSSSIKKFWQHFFERTDHRLEFSDLRCFWLNFLRYPPSLIYSSVSPHNSIQNFEKLVKKSWAINFECPWIRLVSFRVRQSDWSVLGSVNLIGRFYGSFDLIGQF
jgi:hypothetical protein